MRSALVGSKIVKVRKMTKAEMSKEGWDGFPKPIMLVLDTGITIYPSCDEEGNHPGVLFGTTKDHKSFALR